MASDKPLDPLVAVRRARQNGDVGRMIDALSNTDLHVREAAARSLGVLGAEPPLAR